MPAALILSALLTGFVAISGFLFGQLFVGHFSVIACVVGFAGLASAVGAIRLAGGSGPGPRWVKWACLAAVLGVIADAADYYLHLAIPGNYYAWGLIGPYALCLCFIGVTAHRRSAQAG